MCLGMQVYCYFLLSDYSDFANRLQGFEVVYIRLQPGEIMFLCDSVHYDYTSARWWSAPIFLKIK